MDSTFINARLALGGFGFRYFGLSVKPTNTWCTNVHSAKVASLKSNTGSRLNLLLQGFDRRILLELTSEDKRCCGAFRTIKHTSFRRSGLSWLHSIFLTLASRVSCPSYFVVQALDVHTLNATSENSK